MSAADRRRSEGDHMHYRRDNHKRENVRENRQRYYTSYRHRNRERRDEKEEERWNYDNMFLYSRLLRIILFRFAVLEYCKLC